MEPLIRRRRLVAYVRAVALAALTFAAGATVTAGDPAAATPSDEAAFVSALNQTRVNAGVPPLVVDAELTVLSRGWAQAMLEAGQISHASPISSGVTAPWLKLGENVGTGPNVSEIMTAFINSPSHYANIIDPEFTRVGVGVVWDGPRMYTTHRFMKVQGESAPDPEPPATPVAEAPPTPTPTTPTPVGTPPTAPPPPSPPEVPAPAVPPSAQPERVMVVLNALRALAL